MTQTPKIDENTLSQLAYAGYIHGRLASCLPEASPLREKLATRYAAPRQSPVEPLCYLVGLRDAAGIIQGPAALLDVVHRTLELAEAKQPQKRRPRRRDQRWGARS